MLVSIRLALVLVVRRLTRVLILTHHIQVGRQQIGMLGEFGRLQLTPLLSATILSCLPQQGHFPKRPPVVDILLHLPQLILVLLQYLVHVGVSPLQPRAPLSFLKRVPVSLVVAIRQNAIVV